MTKIIRFLRSYGLLITLIANGIAMVTSNGVFSFSKYVNRIGLVRESVSPYKLYVDEKTKVYHCVLLCTYKQLVPHMDQLSKFKIITIDKSKMVHETTYKGAQSIKVYANTFESLRVYDIKPYEFNEGLSAEKLSEQTASLREITDIHKNTGTYLDKDNNASIYVDLRNLTIWSDTKRHEKNQEYNFSQALYVISAPFDVVTLPTGLLYSCSRWAEGMRRLQ